MGLIKSEDDLRVLVFRELQPSSCETSIEDLGRRLPEFLYPDALFATPPPYWQRLKEEFRLFLCTTDKKYALLRRELKATGNKTQTVIVSTIAAAMAHSLGVAAGILMPFCALCLLALAKMGKEALCSSVKFDVPISS
jgi:hypothetical protein